MAADISALISDQKYTADALVSAARGEIANSGQLLNSLVAGLSPVPSSQINPALPAAFVPAVPPVLQQTTVDITGAPLALGTLSDPGNPLDGVGNAPTFSATKPSVTEPARPGDLPAFTAQVPDIDLTVELPSVPDLITIQAPTIAERTIRAAPSFTPVVFDAMKPVAPDGPGDFTGEFENAYRAAAPMMIQTLEGQLDARMAKINPQYSQQLAAIENQLTRYLQGGTGFTPAIEAAMHERARDKIGQATRAVRDATYAEAAARGFKQPQGATLAAIQLARQSGADNYARSAIDIAIKQAEIEQQNLQFAVTTSAGLRATALNASLSYHSNLIQINGQALDYAQSVLQSIITAYNARVTIYQAQLDAWRAEVQVYEVRIKAAMQDIEAWKVEIDALQALTQVDQARVGIYKAQIDAQLGNLAIYRAEVDGIVAVAQLEKLKLDVFGAQVQAFGALVSAKNSEYQGYAAAWRGEESKVSVYSTQAQAFGQEITAWKAKVEAGNLAVTAKLDANRLRVQAKTAEWQGYQAKMGAEGQRVNAVVRYQEGLLTQYGQANAAAIASAQSQLEAYKVTQQIVLERGKLDIQNAIESGRLKLQGAEGVAKVALAAAGIYSQMAGSALSGMNTLVQTEAA